MTSKKPVIPTQSATDYSFGAESVKERYTNDQIADGLVAQLVEHGFVANHPKGKWQEFHDWEEVVHNAFDVPVSSITTRMARLLFALARDSQPRTIVCAGSAWGNALVWLAGGAPKARCIGIDIDADSSALAARNFTAVNRDIEILVADARNVSDMLPEIDLLLLDADDPESGKGILVPILEALWGKLSDGALVLAHDATLPTFKDDFVAYRATLVRLAARKTIVVPIDRCGLEVTLL